MLSTRLHYCKYNLNQRMQHWFTHLGLRAQIEDPNNEAQHIKLLHQPNALLTSFKGLNALSVPRLEAEISAWTTVDCGCMWTLCERWWVVGGVAWGEAFGCCHRHIRAKHQSSPFIRGCLGLSAPPSADESSIIDQTKYIQQPCHHYFSQLGSLQPSPQEQEGFFLKDAELNYIGVTHWTKMN